MPKKVKVRNNAFTHVGRRGTIVIPSSIRRRYGLNDGASFVSEEREEGVLIRPADEIPGVLDEVREKIRVAIEQLDRGEGIPGDMAEAALIKESEKYRSRS